MLQYFYNLYITINIRPGSQIAVSYSSYLHGIISTMFLNLNRSRLFPISRFFSSLSFPPSLTSLNPSWFYGTPLSAQCFCGHHHHHLIRHGRVPTLFSSYSMRNNVEIRTPLCSNAQSRKGIGFFMSLAVAAACCHWLVTVAPAICHRFVTQCSLLEALHNRVLFVHIETLGFPPPLVSYACASTIVGSPFCQHRLPTSPAQHPTIGSCHGPVHLPRLHRVPPSSYRTPQIMFFVGCR